MIIVWVFIRGYVRTYTNEAAYQFSTYRIGMGVIFFLVVDVVPPIGRI